MAKAAKIDYVLLLALLGLLIFGFLILASVSFPVSQQKFGNNFYYLNHQLLFGFLPGLILGFLAFIISLNFFKKWAPLFLLINIIMLIMVFLPFIGLHLQGGSRWLNLGFITFQPSELLKLTFVLYLASWLASRSEKHKELGKTLIAFLFVIGIISLLLIKQPDVSTLGVIVVTAILMYFLADAPFWHIFLIGLIGVLGLALLTISASYRLDRVKAFLGQADPMGKGYQAKQLEIAIGSGGLFGTGLGLSEQKFGYLPQSFSDSVFAILAEETGLTGCLILLFLFLLFFWRGFKIAKNSRDKFSQLTAVGITLWMVIQALTNIASMTGILPLAGIPLPFISYGGSALISELIGAGILLNISKSVSRAE